jgi:hypothetical protein
MSPTTMLAMVFLVLFGANAEDGGTAKDPVDMRAASYPSSINMRVNPRRVRPDS